WYGLKRPACSGGAKTIPAEKAERQRGEAADATEARARGLRRCVFGFGGRLSHRFGFGAHRSALVYDRAPGRRRQNARSHLNYSPSAVRKLKHQAKRSKN